MSMKIWGKRMLALACAGAMLVPLAACGWSPFACPQSDFGHKPMSKEDGI